MSKIIDALEKARGESVVDSRALVNERDTLAPLEPRRPEVEPAPRTRVRKRKEGHAVQLATVRNLDPQALEGVDPHIETLRKPMSVVSEQYRALRNRIERLNYEGKVQSIAITSAMKGEGKSVNASNLAVVLAQDATKEVILIDADLRRPKIHKLLGLPQSPGLAEYLMGDAPREEIVHQTPYFGLHVVTAGDVTGHPGEVLASPELEAFAAECRRNYDYVIFDTPPLHPISDVSFLTEWVDGTIVVVRANKTSKGLLKQATATLPTNKILGTLLNRAEGLTRSYGGYGKGGYYYKYY